MSYGNEKIGDVQVGVVGLGFMAATHLKAYQKVERCRVAALCSPSGKRLDGNFSGVAGNIGETDGFKFDMTSVKAYRSFQDMLANPNISLIDICAPTSAHVQLSLAAFKAGKHVICEKPLARSTRDAREILEAARFSEGFFMPAMCLRFWPEWTWLRAAIVNKTYGQVTSASFRRLAEAPAWGQTHFGQGKFSGGALFDLHIHDSDFVQFCFGRPEAVFSTGRSIFSGAIDHVITQYRTSLKAPISAEGSWGMTRGFGFNMSYMVNFENATADYDFSRGKELLKLFRPDRPVEVVNCAGEDGYVMELRHMIESILNNKKPTIVTLEEGVSAVEICEAEEKSALTGKIVEL